MGLRPTQSTESLLLPKQKGRSDRAIQRNRRRSGFEGRGDTACGIYTGFGGDFMLGNHGRRWRRACYARCTMTAPRVRVLRRSKTISRVGLGMRGLLQLSEGFEMILLGFRKCTPGLTSLFGHGPSFVYEGRLFTFRTFGIIQTPGMLPRIFVAK